MTQQENCKKSAKNRDYKFISKNHQNKRCVKTTNCSTNEVSYYNSMYSIQQYLRINVGIVKMVCEGLNNCKTDISKKNHCIYIFEYIKPSELPDNYRKSANKRPKRVTDEDKKQTLKNGNKKIIHVFGVIKQ